MRWLNIIWKRYKDKSIYARKQAELFLDEEESSIEDEVYFEDLKDKSMEDGNNTDVQKRLGIDINMIGAREETLGKTRSETKELSSPTNESMERADLTMEDWIQETCFISAVTSGPNEPKTFQEAWHSPVKEERENWQKAIRKEIKNMIERGVWRKVNRKYSKQQKTYWKQMGLQNQKRWNLQSKVSGTGIQPNSRSGLYRQLCPSGT